MTKQLYFMSGAGNYCRTDSAVPQSAAGAGPRSSTGLGEWRGWGPWGVGGGRGGGIPLRGGGGGGPDPRAYMMQGPWGGGGGGGGMGGIPLGGGGGGGWWPRTREHV